MRVVERYQCTRNTNRRELKLNERDTSISCIAYSRKPRLGLHTQNCYHHVTPINLMYRHHISNQTAGAPCKMLATTAAVSVNMNVVYEAFRTHYLPARALGTIESIQACINVAPRHANSAN